MSGLGKSTAVSTPSTVTWVCSDGIVISVATAPEKINAVCLAGRESVRVVEGNVKVVSKLVIPVTVTVSSPFTVTWYEKSALLALPVVPSIMTTVILVGVMLVTENDSLNSTVVSTAATSTTEEVPLI